MATESLNYRISKTHTAAALFCRASSQYLQRLCWRAVRSLLSTLLVEVRIGQAKIKEMVALLRIMRESRVDCCFSWNHSSFKDLDMKHKLGTMGRRRKRSDSDNDESLEQSYSKVPPAKAEDEAKPAEETSQKQESAKKVNSKTPMGTSKKTEISGPSFSEEEQKKIERLRQKKMLRKEMKKSKVEAKKEGEVKKANAASSSKLKPDAASKVDKDAFVQAKKGVHYRDVIVGKGPPIEERKKVRVAYVLRAKERYGKILDSSNDFRFRVGRGEVIKGWDIGVLGMRQGGKRHLKVPPQAGYGQRDVGAGKGGLLFFEVTALVC